MVHINIVKKNLTEIRLSKCNKKSCKNLDKRV